MQKRTQLALALTALTAALASCGTPSAPVPSAPLVSVDVAAPMAFAPAPQGLGAQGLTADAPARHYDVTVRDSSGKIVAFDGTTFDPTGAGSKTLTLDSANNFKQTLLLPAGTYTFENKVKDDATGSVLLAYGPAEENPGTVDATGSAIFLKSHAVYDAVNSTLEPTFALTTLYTDTTFNLSLKVKAATVVTGSGDRVATVPTSDIGPVTYSLGHATDGVLNGAGSKIGVNVTSRGTASDSELNVTATFQAWVRNAGTDTASRQTVTEDFAHAIQTNVMTTDAVPPTLTMNTATATAEAATTLTGTVSDAGEGGMIQDVRVYVDGNLKASSNVAEQGTDVAAVTVSGTAWTAGWTPAAEGARHVVVIADDTSGNEDRQEQTVMVAPKPTYSEASWASLATTPLSLTVRQGETLTVHYTAGPSNEIVNGTITCALSSRCVNIEYSYDGVTYQSSPHRGYGAYTTGTLWVRFIALADSTITAHQ